MKADLLKCERAIARSICRASTGVNRAENTLPLARCVPILGLPILFFILFVYKNVDGKILYVYIKCKK